MRIPIDECAPRALKKHLMNHRHECRTVQEAGWSGKQNGELLRLAEAALMSWLPWIRISAFNKTLLAAESQS